MCVGRVTNEREVVMNIGEVLNGVYDDDLGWRPASGGIKPVHVANGIVRAIQGRYFDVNLLGSFAVWWKQKNRQLDETRTFEALTSGESSRFGYLASNKEAFEKTRRFVLGFLGSDRALFPSIDHSSFSLTCGRMATRDTSDYGLGELGAFLLGTGDGTLRSEVERSIGVAIPGDPISALAWPLLDDFDGRDTGSLSSRAGRFKRASSQKHNKAIFDALRTAAESLASHERQQGNRLRTLQRAVQFVCVATHAHAQALASDGALNERPPALVAIAGNRQSDVAIASERSVDQIYARFEQWLGDRLSGRIADGKSLTTADRHGEVLTLATTDGRTARSLLGGIGVAEKGHGLPGREELDVRVQHFLSIKRDFDEAEPAEVLGHCLVQCYLDEYESGGPRPFLQGLGRKSGLLYPHFQGRAKEKRVRPSVSMLDVITRACVEHGTAIEFNDFLERLWIRFGMIVGGRRSDDWDDVQYLEGHSLAVSIEELGLNTDGLIDQLELMGLARRYPDGVTFVGNGYGG
jgi:hypothetical protein